jgi:hypothetical protein
MPFLNTLEKYLGRLAIPGLIRYVVVLNALVFILGLLNPPSAMSPGYVSFLTLEPDAIRAGQVWRLVTWIFVPTVSGFIWMLFYLMFTWWMGDLIESTWGTFRLNLYYFTGYLGCTAAALFFGASFGNTALNMSLLFAAGTIAPELQILLFGIIPLRLKWIALFSAALLMLSLISGDWGTRAAIAVAYINYLLFFGPAFIRNSADARKMAARRAKFEIASMPTETLHCCHTCARTEASNPELEFRVSSDGHEYCTAHLPARKN